MRNIFIFLVLLGFLLGCNNANQILKPVRQDGTTPNKAIVKDSQSEESTRNALNYFNSHKNEIERKEVDLTWLKIATNYSPDRGAMFYNCKDFDVLQVETFGSLGKVEKNSFIVNKNIFHIQQIEYKYDHPYEIPGFKIVKSDTLDYFLKNKKIMKVEYNGKINELTDEITRKASSALEEAETILEKMNK